MATCCPLIGNSRGKAQPSWLPCTQKSSLEITHWGTPVRALQNGTGRMGSWKDKCFLKKAFLLHQVNISQEGMFFKSSSLTHLGSLWPNTTNKSGKEKAVTPSFQLSFEVSTQKPYIKGYHQSFPPEIVCPWDDRSSWGEESFSKLWRPRARQGGWRPMGVGFWCFSVRKIAPK